jgi:hypothetical protein
LCWIAGVVLSRLVEPGVAVEKLILAGDTPAIHLCSRAPGSHPVVLLAHGVTASKETLFRPGEALAAAGFDCYTVDLAGHGESRLRFSRSELLQQLNSITKVIGTVDVFIGHSMGAGVGAAGVQMGIFHPKLFVAIGANVDLGERAPPLLLLAGKFDELVNLAGLKARSDARLVISPWSDHALEVWDPVLVNAAVAAACATVGKTPPSVPHFWLLRLAGVFLGMIGALGLIWFLPELSGPFARIRGPLVSGLLIVTIALTMNTWIGSALNLHRIPLQAAIGIMIWLMLLGIRKLGWRRWIIALLVTLNAFAWIILQEPLTRIFGSWGVAVHLLSIFGVIIALLFWAGTVPGGLAARRGQRSDGDFAMAIFVAYAIGQWIPKFL